MTNLTRYELGDALGLPVSDETWDRFCALKDLVEIAKSDAELIGPAVFAAYNIGAGFNTPKEAVTYALSNCGSRKAS